MRKFGLKGLSLGDQRDAPLSFRIKQFSGEFPVLADIPPVKYLICSPVVDQAELGSCGAFALLAHKAATDEENSGNPLNLSQLWLYYRYRERFAHVEYDDGVFLRDLIKVLAADGVCTEEDWPYVLANWDKKPPAETYARAIPNRIQSYHALYTRGDMIQCLASGYGFIGGIGCYEGFDSLYTEQTGIVKVPDIKEKLLGWHAIYFGGGYDLHRDMIMFQNSYGTGWGKDGFGWIPISYLMNPRLAGDFWTVRS